MSYGVQSDGNRIEFLLDGRDFFARLETLLDRVRAAPCDPNTYVRMSFWEVQPGLWLPGGATLAHKLADIATAGHDVKVVVWTPDDASVQLSDFAGCLRVDALSAQRELHGRGSGRLSVYVAKADRILPGSSLHYKVAIASLGGQRVALIGGMNLRDSYDDTSSHPGPGVPMHDTGMQLEGPATDAIEAEWVKTWSRSGRPFHRNTIPQRIHASEGGTPVKVAIATTDSQGWVRRTDIQSLLVEKIAAARRYIYLENYAVNDPTLVDALCARLQKPDPPLLIVMVTHPILPDAAGFVYSYLNGVAFSKLAFASCKSVAVRDAGPGGQGGTRTISRAQYRHWYLSQSPNCWSTMRSMTATFWNSWMERDQIRWGNSALPCSGESARIADIASFEGGIRFYAPVRTTGPGTWQPIYVHSKLALIDDSVCLCGSANFNYRSMVYDGELSAFVMNASEVRRIREQLFAHYNMTTPEAWHAAASSNRQAYAGGDGHRIPGVHVIPLELSDFSRAVPSSQPDRRWHNFTLY
jgi:phosphatidylserine/phosphatidylglycerophosphate/cardiolipin synthase-like enzyme